MSTDTKHVAADRLLAFVEGVFQGAGVPEAHAHIVAECLLNANLSGVDSHGVVRLAHYVRRLDNRTIKAEPELRFEQTAPSMGIMDGGAGLGHVVTYYACDEAMRMASDCGTGIVSIRNSSHFGMTGYYAKRLAEAGYASLSMTDTDAFLIPFASRKPFFGTNPICFGFPTDGIPLILDMATTSVPYGRLALAQAEGQPIPSTWGLDENGNPTTDPSAVRGLHPIAGPKGSGLAMVIGVLCSVLSGVPWGPHINAMYGEMDHPRNLGHFVMAMDFSRIMPLEQFKASLGEMINEMHALPPAEGFSKVLYPGELEGLRRAQRAAEGIPIEHGLWDELQGLGERFGITLAD